MPPASNFMLFMALWMASVALHGTGVVTACRSPSSVPWMVSPLSSRILLGNSERAACTRVEVRSTPSVASSASE